MIREGKMKKAIVFIVCIVAAVLLISAIVYAAEMVTVTGVAKSFDAKTGRLVLQTAPKTEATFSIPQTVRVYMAAKSKDTKDTEVANVWPYLQNNLGTGTKLRLMHTAGVVNAIWIMEVPR
jgi:flagellar basal body-associated protein FliL